MRWIRHIGPASEWLIILMFGVVLWLPLVLAFVEPAQVYSETEKRFLAKFPELHRGQTGLRALTRGIDQYYQDHFGLREFFIHRYQREVRKRFDRASVPDVVTGKDGWLFYSGEKVLEDLMGRYPLTGEQLTRMADRIRSTREHLEGKGIAYLLLVAPDKQSIYPEYLPEVYQQAKKITRLDQAVAVLNHDPATEILDVRPVLLRNKTGPRLYDKTDTHWNQLGAYCAYRELMRAVAKHFPGVDLHAYFSVGARWRQDPAGDLAQLSGHGDSLSEKRPEVLGWLRAREEKLSLPLQQLLPLKQLQPLRTVRQGKKLRVLVLHDSFMNPMKPFLSESFGEVLYFWKYFDRAIENYLNQDVMDKVVAEFKPDLVIEEVVERHLDWLISRPEGKQSDAPPSG